LDLGEITGTKEKATHIVDQIQTQFNHDHNFKGKAIYLIWKDPIMTAGANTFINELLKLAGFENLIKEERYPKVEIEEIINLNPDYLLLSSEPYPFKQRHVEELTKLLPKAKVLLVDGEMFSWYGSRLLFFNPYILASF
jgi:ABC-type Fe3+-hydroxamate transport system substrate-binding protein